MELNTEIIRTITDNLDELQRQVRGIDGDGYTEVDELVRKIKEDLKLLMTVNKITINA